MKKVFLLIGLILVFLFPFGAMWGGRVLEHHPPFCISCHEMKPSYDGWIASGAAKNHPDCIKCHGEAGFWGTVDSELRGLRFIKVHFFENRPANAPFMAKVPEEYCLQCHKSQKILESHKMLMTVGHTCADCHKHKIGSRFSGEVKS